MSAAEGGDGGPKPIKSPFLKGGFRGIFNWLIKIPPHPPSVKGGCFLKLTRMRLHGNDDQRSLKSFEMAFAARALSWIEYRIVKKEPRQGEAAGTFHQEIATHGIAGL